MATRTKNKSPRKKPIVGSRIQQICPAPPGWRAVMLVTDDKDRVVVDGDDPRFFAEDVGAWALIVDEGKTNRFQQIWPCISEVSGILEPVSPETPEYIGLASPEYDHEMIEGMVAEVWEDISDKVDTVEDDEEEEVDESSGEE